MASALKFEDYDDSFEHVTARRTITEFDASSFIATNGFNTPMFMDLDYAASGDLHGGRIIPGMLTISIAEGLCIGSGLVGEEGLALLEYRLTFQRPCFAGDTVYVRITLDSKRLTRRPDRGVVATKHEVINQHGDVVATYWATRLLKTRQWTSESSISGGSS
jgi:acyl dehydratase